ncbi:MAG TPA: recombinase family protein [Solirubrobacterales bacterium]|nr:recombinase family protein [Solirubrobacterales bacterium]
MSHDDNLLGIVYAAKSSPDEGGSIGEQIEDVREMFEDEGREVIAVFSEENVSAYKGNRGRELEAAIRLAKEKGATIGVQSPDRLARGNVKDARHLVEIAIEALTEGFALASVEEPETFTSLSAAAAAGDQSHLYVKKLASKVKKGHRRSRERGNIGGSRSLGYELLRKQKPGRDTPREVRVIPAEAVIVVRIYDEYLAGRTQLGISRDLARDKVPTATGGKWYSSTVRQMLANALYTGLVRQGGRKGTEFVEADHERIIERDKWEAVQTMMAAKSPSYSRGRSPAGSHLFRRGLLRCECGAAMVPRTERGGRERYRCFARLRDSASCSMPTVKRAEVDSAVFDYFTHVALDVEATREQLRKARDHKLAEVGALLNVAEREAAEAAAAVARIERDYISGRLDVDDWNRIKTKLAAEGEAAEANRDRLRDQFAQVEADADFLATEAEVVEELAQVRSAIAGEITDAEGIEAVRAVLVRQFDAFVLRREGMVAAPRKDGWGWEPREPEITDVHLDDDPIEGQRWIEPVPSAHAIKGFDESCRPVLRREPLVQAGNNSDPVRTGS